MVRLDGYDFILVNTSGGKDSQAMLDEVVRQARAAGVESRLVAVHCDLGRVEWPGVRELAQRQVERYGVRFEVVSRPQGDLLTHVRARKMWPSSTARYCTSDHKRGQVGRLLTQLARESKHPRPRILNCLGLRAQESSARAKLVPFQRDVRNTNGRRVVDTWLPIHDWSEAQVWARIEESGVEHHEAYDLGMPRLSCAFCIFAPKAALVVAGRHNRALLDEYIAVEREIGHTFKHNFSLVEVAQAVDNGQPAGPVANWSM